MISVLHRKNFSRFCLTLKGFFWIWFVWSFLFFLLFFFIKIELYFDCCGYSAWFNMVNYSNCPSVGPCHVYTARIKITESKLSSMEYWVHISKCGCVSGEGMSSIYLCTQKPTHYVCFWAAMVIHFMSFLPLSVTDGVCIMRFKKKKKLKKTSHTHTLLPHWPNVPHHSALQVTDSYDMKI